MQTDLLVQHISEAPEHFAGEVGTSVNIWHGGERELPQGATYFGFVAEGECEVECDSGSYRVTEGKYFSIPGGLRLAGRGIALVVARLGYKGLFSLGGPLESLGRLRYIDGCSDTVLISPPRLGDPCLNMLYVPPGVDQTEHTHPSIRVGIVVAGEGECRFSGETTALTEGDLFVLPTDVVHSFHTKHQFLKIVVYHPDSDCGPSDDAHPMVTRTLIEGISASQLPKIRTQDISAGVPSSAA